MTFFFNSCVKTYSFTAFSASQLLSQGTLGSSVSVGDCFKLPAAADTRLNVLDDDSKLSGDSLRDESADDSYGQTASITTSGVTAANAGQIYAESYFWVQDTAGRSYMLIEIEQEGGGSYYTFNTAYGFPCSGVSLKIVSQCNVTSQCISYDTLGAGALEKLGTVSGTVFSDTNCDGIDGIQTTVPGTDYLIEAESMCKSSFVTVCSSGASGGKFVRLACNGGTGELATNFNGKAGTYDVILRVQDENDGQSTIKLLVDGQYVDAIRLDRDSDGQGSDCGGFSTFVIRNVKLDACDQIKLSVCSNGGEFVRIDNIKLEGHDTTVLTPEPTKSGVTVQLVDLAGKVVASTTTDANGNYAFENVKAGQYKVVGVAPDGTKFTLKDAGSNDAIDSDVGADGASDVISVKGGQTSDIDLGLCTIKYGSIAGRHFLDANQNNVDDAESGVAGVKVSLLNAAGTEIATTTTASDGSYIFSKLVAGDYYVQFTASNDGLVFDAKDSGANEAIDSDANAATGRTDKISLAAGEVKVDVDAGIKDPKTAAVGDTVFIDANGNGVYDAGDAAADGVTVQLLDGNGVVVGTTTTANGGQYAFTGLAAGSYAVAFGTLAGYGYTTQSAAGAEVANNDSDAGASGVTKAFVLSAGEVETDIDAGLLKLNIAPDAQNDVGGGCADDPITVNVLGNDTDADSDPLSITAVNGIAIAEGKPIVINGVEISLDGDELIFNGTSAYDALDIGQKATADFTYTVSDGKGGTDDATVSVTFCGDANSVQSFSDSIGGNVTFQVAVTDAVQPVEPEAFSVKIIDADGGRFDGDIFGSAYCLSFYDHNNAAETFPGPDISGRFISSLSANAASVFDADQISVFNKQAAADNLDLINWILNQDFEAKGTYTGWEVQRAMWQLVDNKDFAYLDRYSGYGKDANVDKILAEAALHDGYVPDLNGKLGLLVDPNDGVNEQPLILSVNIQDYDCLCLA